MIFEIVWAWQQEHRRTPRRCAYFFQSRAAIIRTTESPAPRESTDMKHFTFDNRWDEIKGQLKQRFAQLTDEDLTFVEGRAAELLARLREKLSLSAQDLEALLNELWEAVETRAGRLADELRDKAGATYDQARQRARGLLDEGGEYVRKNPRESLVAALCAGFVAGLLIRH